MNLFRSKHCNYTNQKFNGSVFLLVALALACFAISPVAKAVVPAPDGGYPGFTTAEGDKALFSLTSGTENTAVGTDALVHNDTGSFNIAVGDDTLSNNVSGSNNIIVGGFGAGFNIVADSNNIYIGPGVSANGPFDESDTIRINDSAPAAGGATSQVFVAGIDGSTVGAVNAPVLINPNGQLGTGSPRRGSRRILTPWAGPAKRSFPLNQ